MGESKQRVVIVGGGFGGLNVAQGLKGAPVEVVLIDQRNHHTFQPLLYQVAMAGLSPADIATPIRRVLRRQENANVILGEVTSVDAKKRTVRCSTLADPLEYDYLVLACGATHAYFGNDEWAAHAPGLKTLEDALEIRRRMLVAYEAAETETDAQRRRALLTFVVVGGGPTGVELAGAIREIAVESIQRDFRHVDTRTARVVLVEAQERMLPTMSEAAGTQAAADLRALGVEVRLNTRVTGVDGQGVDLGDERLEAGNVYWAAGVKAASLGACLDTERDRAGRVKVAPDCSIAGHPEVFVVGDMAAQTSSDTGEPVPGVAQGAIQTGQYVAGLIRDETSEGASVEARPPFSYYDKGSMATIGVARAVADIGSRTFTGTFAWLLWSVVHVMFLVSFRNRLFVMLHWAYNYALRASGARLITGDPVKLLPGAAASPPPGHSGSPAADLGGTGGTGG